MWGQPPRGCPAERSEADSPSRPLHYGLSADLPPGGHAVCFQIMITTNQETARDSAASRPGDSPPGFRGCAAGADARRPAVLAQQTAKYPQTIVFMTDFGVVDDSVAICRGVMYSIMPEVRIVDLTHQVTPFSILDGARFLYGATPYYPAGTVFVVVDRSHSWQHAQSDRRQVEARTIFRAAR